MTLPSSDLFDFTILCLSSAYTCTYTCWQQAYWHHTMLASCWQSCWAHADLPFCTPLYPLQGYCWGTLHVVCPGSLSGVICGSLYPSIPLARVLLGDFACSLCCGHGSSSGQPIQGRSGVVWAAHIRGGLGSPYQGRSGQPIQGRSGVVWGCLWRSLFRSCTYF